MPPAGRQASRGRCEVHSQARPYWDWNRRRTACTSRHLHRTANSAQVNPGWRTISTGISSPRCNSGQAQSVKFEPPLLSNVTGIAPAASAKQYTCRVTKLTQKVQNALNFHRFLGNHSLPTKCIEILDMINRLQHIYMLCFRI